VTRPSRLAAIDWLRGVAVACMVLWHVTDSWHTAAGRDTAGFGAVVFFGGWAAPMFVFLAGLSLTLAAGRHLEEGASRAEAARRLRRRGWQIFLFAHLFRLQSFLLDSHARWDSLFKADILNVLGLGIVVAGWAWQRADTGGRRLLYLLAPALVVGLVLTPWAPLWAWPGHLPDRLEGYVRVSGDNAVFSLFPAVGYVFAGAYVGGGRLMKDLRTANVGGLFSTGGMLVVGPFLWGWLPLPAPVDEWTGAFAVATFRVGVMLILLGLASRMLRDGIGPWQPVVTLGQASLFAYWIHVEPVYGVFSRPLHGALGLGGALAGFAAVLVTTWAFSVWWLKAGPGRPWIPVHMVAPGPFRIGLRLS
jgi:uncharacterized membrane protein